MLNLNLNTSYKQDRFFKTLPKKSLEFALNKKDDTIIFNLNFVLLLVKVNPVLKKQNCKKDVLIACNSSYIQIVFILLIKVVAFYI